MVTMCTQKGAFVAFQVYCVSVIHQLYRDIFRYILTLLIDMVIKRLFILSVLTKSTGEMRLLDALVTFVCLFAFLFGIQIPKVAGRRFVLTTRRALPRSMSMVGSERERNAERKQLKSNRNPSLLTTKLFLYTNT